jgi:hypothetical protein
LQDLIQVITLAFCGHGARVYNAVQASQWYESTRATRSPVTSLFVFSAGC